jgi:hypothetical protein
MKISRRSSLIILLLLLIALLGIQLRAIILTTFILPIAAMFWLFWRLLITVDQPVYWGFLIFSAVVYAFIRLTKGPHVYNQTHQPDPNTALETMSYWRTSMLVTRDEIEGPNILKSNLGKMLASLYAVQQPETPPYAIYSALKQHQIHLPKRAYDFLFPQEASGSWRSFQKILHFVLQAPKKWIRKKTGRDVAEYFQAIDEVVNLMESLMEIKEDDNHSNANNH